jgi:hypothetical protein
MSVQKNLCQFMLYLVESCINLCQFGEGFLLVRGTCRPWNAADTVGLDSMHEG